MTYAYDPAYAYHPADRLRPPPDAEAPRRAERLRQLGLAQHPDQEFDRFAAALAAEAGTPLAMVNLISDKRQYFAGLHAPSLVQAGPGAVALPDDPARVMDKDQGWCPHVLARKNALIMGDVFAFPRFAGNPVVDEIGIRAYMGAPLICTATGVALGTVCCVDTQQRDWDSLESVEFIKARAAAMMKIIANRRP